MCEGLANSELRDTILRILCGEEDVPRATPSRRSSELATRAGLRVYEARLATLDETEARLADDPVRTARLGPLRLGRAVFAAALSFWSSVAEAPDSPGSWRP